MSLVTYISNSVQNTPLDALRHRNFGIYVSFEFLASIGAWIQRISIQWLVWELTHSYFWLGGIVVTEAIGLLLIMPFAGVWVDQFDRLLLARLARGAHCILAFCLAVVAYLDQVSLLYLIALVFLVGAAEGFWTSTRMAIVPNLVPRQSMAKAISINAMSFQFAQFVGPAIAGLLIVFMGVELAFLINVILLISVVLAYTKLSLVNETERDVSSGFVSRIVDAVQYLKQSPGILRLILMMTVFSFTLRPHKDFFAGYADGVFGAGAQGFAILAAASGLGSLFATIKVGSRSSESGRSRQVFVMSGWCLFLLIVLALMPSLYAAVVVVFFLGFSQTCAGVSSQILLQQSLDDKKRGRVMSLYGMQLKAAPSLGAFCVGILAVEIGIQNSFLFAAMLFTVAIFTLIWRYRASISALDTGARN